MNKAKNAEESMKAHRMNCAQTVLTAFSEELGLDKVTAIKLASGFGGGMARTGKTCGAVTGAYMVLGLAQKIDANNPRESLDRTYSLVQEFNRQFKAKYGSLTCKKLLNYDLNTAAGLKAAREKNVFTTACPNFVRDSVAIVEKLIE